MRTYSTRQAAKLVGVSYITLWRWISEKIVRPSIAVPMDGRTLWRWTREDVERARKLKATRKRGPKPKQKKKGAK